MTLPLISLGDGLRAVDALAPEDPAARDAILALLGLGRPPSVHVAPALGPWLPSSSEGVVVAPRPSAARPDAPKDPVRGQPPPGPLGSGELVPAKVRTVRTGSGRFTLPSWLDEPGSALRTTTPARPPMPVPPLFSRGKQRAILSHMLAAQVPEGDIDLDRVIEDLCAGRPFRELPRRPGSTLRHGADILFDRADAMDPFGGDQDALEGAVRAILPADRLRFLSFVGCPSRGLGAGDRETWAGWSPPGPGTLSVVVTDLGIGGPLSNPERAGTDEWLAFAHRVRAAGCTLVALVPYEAKRWPAPLARAMRIVHWSERTTAGQIMRAMRIARGAR